MVFAFAGYLSWKVHSSLTFYNEDSIVKIHTFLRTYMVDVSLKYFY